jgi:hypothetical protein
MLVGDIILASRVRINDLPRTIASPTGSPLTATNVAVASTLQATTYFVVLTYTNQWGETIATNEVSVTLGANQSIQIQTPLTANFIPGAAGVKAYFGLAAGQENQWQSSTVVPFNISAPGNPGVPPTRNTSFYPDADGQRVSAYTIYSWLNEALEMASKISNGIPDMTGLPTVNGNSSYIIPGLWHKLDHGWWDGYIFTLAGKDSLFYRNVVPGVPSFGVVQQVADRIVIELQPQPNRSGGITTIANAVLATDTSIVLTDVSGFKLPFGMAQLGQNPIEIISFSTLSGTTLGGCIRGLGGSIPAAYAGGGTVYAAEANLRLTGLRVFNSPNYTVGNQSTYLPVPAGWRSALQDYIIAKFREAEGNIQECNRLEQKFTNTILSVLKGNKLVAGPRQCGFPGSGSLDTYPSAGSGGRIIVP